MKAYIYKIENKINGKVYIGITQSTPKKRSYKHFNELKNKTHHSKKLQEDFNKYGIDNFEFKVLDSVHKNYSKTETFWIEKYDSINNGYNSLKGGTGIVTDDTRRNMSVSHIGIISDRRSIANEDAILIYSIFYFYGKMFRPMSKITKYSRDSLKSLYDSNYSDIRESFNCLSIETKFSIFKEANKKYNIDFSKLTYFTENMFYLLHYYINEKVYTIDELRIMFNRTENKAIKNIVIGKVKPDVYKIYNNGIIDNEKLSILCLLARYIGNPVPSLERNFFEGQTTRKYDLS